MEWALHTLNHKLEIEATNTQMQCGLTQCENTSLKDHIKQRLNTLLITKDLEYNTHKQRLHTSSKSMI